MNSIIDISDEPKFSIKAACNQTGIRPVTLRAWERRHEVLHPHRAVNRYRLYSERDVAILRWLKNRVDNGVSIGNAIQELRSMEKNNIWPEALPSAPSITTKPGFPPEYYKEQLYQALVTKNEIRVNDIFHEIHSAFELDVIFNNILRPSMVDIGDALYKGEISFSTEHYASSQIMNKLVSLMQVYPSRRNSAYILIGCAPTENHEISSVMLSILLRKNGYRVEYLGPDVPIDDLVDYAIYEKPDMIVLSAAMETSALELRHVQNKLSRLRKPPLFAYGGQAFYNNANLQNLINGFYLGDTLEKALTNINSQLEQTWKRNKQAISLN